LLGAAPGCENHRQELPAFIPMSLFLGGTLAAASIAPAALQAAHRLLEHLIR